MMTRIDRRLLFVFWVAGFVCFACVCLLVVARARACNNKILGVFERGLTVAKNTPFLCARTAINTPTATKNCGKSKPRSNERRRREQRRVGRCGKEQLKRELGRKHGPDEDVALLHGAAPDAGGERGGAARAHDERGGGEAAVEARR